MWEPRFVKYYPQIFDARDVQHAKRIILTNEAGLDSETRWQIETPYLIELILRSFALGPDMVVLDYGCGIGRMAKAMIDASGCRVVGLDISESMRRLARDYVGSDRFSVVSPSDYDTMVRDGLRVNAAIAVWVLQHCVKPSDDIARIQRSLAADGGLFVLNMSGRAVPIIDGGNKFAWAQDATDVAALLRAEFRVQAEGTPDQLQMQNMAPQSGVYWMSFDIVETERKSAAKVAHLAAATIAENTEVGTSSGMQGRCGSTHVVVRRSALSKDTNWCIMRTNAVP